MARYYRQLRKAKAQEFRKEELDTRAKIEIAMAILHEDAYDVEKQAWGLSVS